MTAEHGRRITIQRGKLRTSFVIEGEPYPKIGDMVRIKGARAEWHVLKVGPLIPVIAITFPKRKKRASA